MIIKGLRFLSAGSLVLAMAACASNSGKGTSTQSATPESTTSNAQPQQAPVDGTNATQSSTSQDGATSLASNHVYYFDFDSAEIRSDSSNLLSVQAPFLATLIQQTPSLAITIEGHADSRGTREYNMALGGRRAAAVSRFLRVNGIAKENLTTVSYGEERPVAIGTTEDVYAQNRRVELIVPGYTQEQPYVQPQQ